MQRRLLHHIAALVLVLGAAAGLAAQETVFEAPVVFAEPNRRFPQAASSGDLAVVAWQRITSQSDKGGLIDIGLSTSTDGQTWADRGSIASNVPYEGLSVPPVYSLAVSRTGEIMVAVIGYGRTSDDEPRVRVAIYRSTDRGASFSEVGVAADTTLSLVAPRLYERADGGWILFFEYVYEGSDSRLVFTRSEAGETWEDLLTLPVDNRLQNLVDLSHTVTGDRDVVVFSGENFTALNAGLDAQANAIYPLPATLHLMSMFSSDGGLTWSAVNPENGDNSGPKASTPVVAAARVSTTVGRAAVEQLSDAAIPYWDLRVSAVGAPDFGVPAYGDLVSRRPDILTRDGKMYVTWEAGVRRDTDGTRQVVVASLDNNANITGPVELLSAGGLTRSYATLAYNQPTIHPDGDGLAVIAYSDPSLRGQVVLYQQGRFGWQETAVSTTGIASFPTAVVVAGHLHVFWQQRDSSTASTARIVHLEPDVSADPPRVAGVNFQIGSRSRSSTAELRWTPAPDAAGIAGYSYVWSRNPDQPVPEVVVAGAEATRTSETADEDGEWYFRIRAVDRLGNWSEPTTVAYFRDTTPPGLVRFRAPQLDEDGYLASNTFSLRWEPPADDVIAGYTYDFVYVAPSDAEVAVDELPVPEPPDTILTTDGIFRENNHDNGLWALSVAAIDSVGNIGDPAVLYVRLNKYIPVTEIWTVTAIPDPLGRYALRIVGRGFLANGRIIQVILDRDEKPPWDYVFGPSSPGFRIYDDRNMTGPLLDDIQTGTYALGLVHEERGLTFSRQRLSLERNGTVKFGEFTVRPGTSFAVRQPQLGFLQSVGALAWVVIALLAVVVVFSGTRMAAVLRDGRVLRLEARALVSGLPLPGSTRAEGISQMKRRGIGLRTKFAFFMVVLIMAVVAMIAIGLGTATLNNQRQILLQGLKDRVDVLMESIVAGAEVVLPEPEVNIVRLTELPRQTDAMEEALYATITGKASAAAGTLPEPGYNYVWGTNDPLIREAGETDPERLREIEQLRSANSIPRSADLGEGETLFVAGTTRVEDPLTSVINQRAAEIDRAAREALGNLPLAIEQKFQAIQDQAVALATTDFATREEEAAAESALARERLALSALNAQMNTILSDIVGGVQSYPEFDPETFTDDQRDFIFYQPITYLDSGEIVGEQSLATANYFKGAVRIGVATDLIVEQISVARQSIIRITLLIAAAAVAAGVVGALLLAALVVIPIRRLVRGVEKIRDTADKRELKGQEIKVRTRDELSRLADTVNDMTKGLVAAAEADEELKVSSDMQKMFMPLESVVTPDGGTRRLTSAHDELGSMELHGYYEGADALSGDYFTYEKLDDTRYALIKCDVAGHGVQAAIIMVEVASIFLNNIRDWRAGRKKPRLSELLATVNEMVFERGFKARFAAMTVGILNVQTGQLRVSHAGDRILKVYRATERSIDERMMNEIPAAGMFSLDMFPPSMGYEEVSTNLNPGDILLLATDGIDEAKRHIRNSRYEKLRKTKEEFDALCAEQGWGNPEDVDDRLGIEWVDKSDKDREGSGEETPEDSSNEIRENFTEKRMHDVITQIQTGGRYVLERALNPDPDERLEFVFRGVEPTAENTVLGLMAVERIFRLMPDPSATERDMVRVDRKIDAFLRDHFSQYSRYFRYEVPEAQRPDKREEYVWFSHLKDEEQLDDLTILAIRKK